MIDYNPKRPLLFLDIDGVLNTHEPFDDRINSSLINHSKVAYLNQVLELADAQYVVSSAWRYCVLREEMNLFGFSQMMRSHGIWNRMVGITGPDTYLANFIPVISTAEGWKKWPKPDERGMQITEWLDSKHHTGPYAVVDDGGTTDLGHFTDLGISAAKHPFVLTDGKRGLTPNSRDRLVAILTGNLKGMI